ncbi:MAG TPA: AbrB/MazE/SpoVT family DNA-binding domain-containing protein [Vicinamibacterales bacterium]|jgi:antitoxin PrlF|nr:AbrB/MazE/SpoVT family DNA-binding domain-containing protein [Vicinamibacterales bacterium]
MPEATLTTKGQVTIPKAVRDHLKLETGARVEFVIEGDGTVVLKPLTRHVHELAGLLYRSGRRPVSIEDMNESIRVHVRKRFRRRR